jgi:hypothetical protein
MSVRTHIEELTEPPGDVLLGHKTIHASLLRVLVKTLRRHFIDVAKIECTLLKIDNVHIGTTVRSYTHG